MSIVYDYLYNTEMRFLFHFHFFKPVLLLYIRVFFMVDFAHEHVIRACEGLKTAVEAFVDHQLLTGLGMLSRPYYPVKVPVRILFLFGQVLALKMPDYIPRIEFPFHHCCFPPEYCFHLTIHLQAYVYFSFYSYLIKAVHGYIIIKVLGSFVLLIKFFIQETSYEKSSMN